MIEDAIASLALLVMAVLPLAEIVVRRFAGGGIPGSTSTVQHLTLVARVALPMLGILAFGVLIITYVPWLTTGLLYRSLLRE